MLGFVKFFDEKKGWGFLVDNGTGLEYFCHFSAIISENNYKVLRENEKVSFDEDTDDKGRLCAKNVRPIN